MAQGDNGGGNECRCLSVCVWTCLIKTKVRVVVRGGLSKACNGRVIMGVGAMTMYKS